MTYVAIVRREGEMFGVYVNDLCRGLFRTMVDANMFALGLMNCCEVHTVVLDSGLEITG